jgi:DNA mismatch repair protein MutL
MPIRVLPDDVANKIAAGEVVERPASVVKELVENALDAEATDIRVELTAGGKRLIRVTDNGLGMAAEDARLCIRRHATSKITVADDLFTVDTLGFRGEALPSIASVSRFEILTCAAGASEGTRVTVEGGSLKDVSVAGCPVGTRVTVSNLFYNVPARLKFLKTETTELGHVVNHVQWAALAFPNIRFVLTHDGRPLIDAPPCENRSERIRLLYGREFSEHLIGFVRSFETVELECFVGDPHLTKPNRASQFFFLNRRPIRDRTIGAALTEAMREVVPTGRFAVAFLFMTMPPDQVDVNVHPSKAEVRFRDERAVFRYVMNAVSQGVAQSRYIPEMGVGTISTATEPAVAEEKPRVEPYPSVDSRVVIPTPEPFYGTRLWHATSSPSPHASTHPHEVRPDRLDFGALARPADARREPLASGDAVPVELLDFDELEHVGALMNTYILVADAQNLYVVDQHVASERVHFERIVTQLRAQQVASQGLLTPISVALSSPQRLAFESQRETLSRFGFDVVEFGGNAALIRAIPAILAPTRAEQVVRDLLDRIGVDWNAERSWEAVEESVAATIACHSAVRAGDRLTPDAQRALLRDLSKTRLPFNCPHGRPIIIRLRRAEIETRFQRR